MYNEWALRLTNGNCSGRCSRPRVPENSSRALPFVLFSYTTFGAGDICFAKSYNLPQTSVTCNVMRKFSNRMRGIIVLAGKYNHC